jgi:hypothetical protein
MTGFVLDDMSVEEAADKVAELKKVNRQIEKGFETDLRKRRADEKAKGVAKKVKGPAGAACSGADVGDAAVEQCAGTTARGVAYKRKVSAGSRFCGKHMAQSEVHDLAAARGGGSGCDCTTRGA